MSTKYRSVGTDGDVRYFDPSDFTNDNTVIVGFTRTRELNMIEEAFVQKIERRMLVGAKKPHEVFTEGEAEKLTDMGVEVKVQIAAPKKQKPTATLADDIVFNQSTDSLLETKIEDRVRALLRSAKRFVLTEDAAVRVAEAIRAYPEMLVEQGVFARTPFDVCWIEMPSFKYHETLAPGTSTAKADTRVGYLFVGDHVYIAAQGPNGSSSLSPLVVHLHHPMGLPEELRFADSMDLSRGQLDQFYWGGLMSETLPWNVKRGLRAQHSFQMKVKEPYADKIKGNEFLQFTAGEIRNIVGLLLMINQPSSVLREQEVERRKTTTHKGTRILMGHSVITLNLDKRSRPDRLLRPPRSAHAAPRWHEVMNHWCNDKVARTKGYSLDDPKTHGMQMFGHAHEWEQDEDGSLKFTCKICGGRRWRRIMSNGRGDKSRGMVSQERIVKTDKDGDIKARLF